MMLGKYQLVSKLATGGMAEVYLARAEGPMGFAKSLVVKCILPHLAADPRFVEMFISEARLAAQLDHPQIVQIFDFGEVDGTWYLAMEYIDGLNLRVLARRAKDAGLPLPPACCVRIVASACEGLAFAHDRRDTATGEPLGLIHRDISPDNILLSLQGAVKVADFGIAKAADQGHKTQAGVIKGKIAYMPPEQIRRMTLDRRVDVYALGVVLYELLTGHRPFDATHRAGLMQAILHEPFVPAEARRPDLPALLGPILERALAKDREQRYPDCRALQTDLERFILSAGETVGAWNLAQLVDRVMAASSNPSVRPISGSEPQKETPEKPPPANLTITTVVDSPGGSAPAVMDSPGGSAPAAERRPWRPRTTWIAAGVGAMVLLVLAGGSGGATGRARWHATPARALGTSGLAEGSGARCIRTAEAIARVEDPSSASGGIRAHRHRGVPRPALCHRVAQWEAPGGNAARAHHCSRGETYREARQRGSGEGRHAADRGSSRRNRHRQAQPALEVTLSDAPRLVPALEIAHGFEPGRSSRT
jgi:serine/threonine protein kinase